MTKVAANMAESAEATPPPPPPRIEEIVEIYGMHTDQILKYHAIQWQIPVALVVGNFLAIEKFATSPLALLALALFDLSMIMVLWRLRIQQRSIVKATAVARERLKPYFGDAIPEFKRHKITAGGFSVFVLFVLWLGLLVHAGLLIARPVKSAAGNTKPASTAAP
jgi:hypothetical protein